MTVEEAASLVLLSAAYDAPGGLFVLDMGNEVRIERLAERLVRLKGLRIGRDIAIQYTGLRPGEKLREELHSDDERLLATERAAVWRVEPDYMVDGRGSAGGCPRSGPAPPVGWCGACGLPRPRAAPDRRGDPRYVRGRRRSLARGQFAALGEIRVCDLCRPAALPEPAESSRTAWCEPDCGGNHRA